MIYVRRMRHNKDIIPTLFILVFVIVMAVLLAMVSESDATMEKDMRFINFTEERNKSAGQAFLVVEIKDMITDSIYNDTIRL